MREIKFRLWNPDLKVLTAGNELNTLLLTTNEEFVKEFDRCGMVWMQYTGLKDVRGKEIYEGDLFQSKEYYYEDCRTEKPELKWRNYYFKVEFKNGGFCGTRLDQNHSFRLTDDRNDEIVGNIYENPISAGL